MGDLWTAIVLGVVEGITEFLPISSTGHLLLLGELLKFEGSVSHAFEIVIQLGAILAAVFAFKGRFFALLPSFEGQSSGLSGYSGCQKLILATVPVLVIGALFHKQIKGELFSSFPIAVAFILGGIVMLLVERKNRSLGRDVDEITTKDAVIIGVAQALALWPGISRSGVTIVAAMLLGINRRASAEFSFLIAVPVMVAAAGHSIIGNYSSFSYEQTTLLLVGFIVSFLSALLAIKAFLLFLNSFTLRPFAYYRIALGVMILVLI